MTPSPPGRHPRPCGEDPYARCVRREFDRRPRGGLDPRDKPWDDGCGDGRMTKTPTSRVDRLLGSMGYGSRAEMARMAKAGGIVLDGADLTDVSKRIPVTPDLPTRMEIDGEPLDPVPGLVLMLNKPLGMTCSHKEEGALVYDILPDRWRRRDPAISTIGRLDKQTSGLLLLTDDGRPAAPGNQPQTPCRQGLLRRAGAAAGGDRRRSVRRRRAGAGGRGQAAGARAAGGRDADRGPADGDGGAVITRCGGCSPPSATTSRPCIASGMGGLVLPPDLAPGEWRLLAPEEVASIFAETAGG